MCKSQVLDKDYSSIEDVDGEGRVEVAASDKAAIDEAVKRVKAIAFPPTVEIGEVYEGKVILLCLTEHLLRFFLVLMGFFMLASWSGEELKM